MDAPHLSRRRFLQQTALAAVGLAAEAGTRTVRGDGGSGAAVPSLSIVAPAGDPLFATEPVQWALDQLVSSMVKRRSGTARVYRSVAEAPPGTPLIVVASAAAPLAREIAQSAGVALPDGAEALILTPGSASGRPVILACGADVRGIQYAALEMADRLRQSGSIAVATGGVAAVSERPASRVRSICRSFTSESQDKPWFNRRQFWVEYLAMLAIERYNRLHLAFGIGYNSVPKGPRPETYLFFAYPFLVAVPSFPEVRAVNLPEAERDANLETLRFISGECARRGLDFHLGIWSHAYQYGADADYPIQGLNPGNHAEYCRDALAAILTACPGITGVTFRVHSESGVPAGSYRFWATVFDGVRRAGRPIDLNLHAKECTQQHIDLAAAVASRVAVGPKYVAEHQGLPYHEASIQERERKAHADPTVLDGQCSRYGYANFLKEDRTYGVLYRIWPGTQRLLLWADPVFAAGYGRASSFCGSDGVEWMEPLTFRARQGSPSSPGRCGYRNPALEPGLDFSKFRWGYRIWGRCLYNPDCDPEVWRRWYRREIGEAARPAEDALANVSRILLLVTTYHAVAVDNQAYWPEIYTNVPIVGGRMASVGSFDPQLFASIDETVRALEAGSALQIPKYNALEVADWLQAYVDAGERGLAAARAAARNRELPTFRRFEADVAILAGLGRFFAEKLRATHHWALYQATGSPPFRDEAETRYAAARKAWSELAAAGAVYVDDLAFGDRPAIHGHWRDRLPAIDADLAAMKAAPAVPLRSPLLRPMRALADRPRLGFRHTPPASFDRGKDFAIQLSLAESCADLEGVTLFYRHVNEAERWQEAPMAETGGAWSAAIPAAYTRLDYPIQYYAAVRLRERPAALLPGFDASLANQPYFVVRAA